MNRETIKSSGVKYSTFFKSELSKIYSRTQLGMTLYALIMSTMSTLFQDLSNVKIHPNPNVSFLALFVTSSLIIVFMSGFLIMFDAMSTDRARLCYLLFPSWQVAATKVFASFVGILFRLSLVFLIFVAKFNGDITDWGVIIGGIFKFLVPALALQVLVFLACNYAQSFTRDMMKANVVLLIPTIILLAPIIGISFWLTFDVKAALWFSNNALWIQAVPLMNLLSPLLSASDNWYGSFFFIIESFIVVAFVWKVYCKRMKNYFVSTSE